MHSIQLWFDKRTKYEHLELSREFFLRLYDKLGRDLYVSQKEGRWNLMSIKNMKTFLGNDYFHPSSSNQDET